MRQDEARLEQLRAGRGDAPEPRKKKAMDNRFDELAKALAGGMSRREALWRLAGGFTGALLASLGLENAWGFKPKPKIDKLCKDFCKNLKHGDKEKYDKCLTDCGTCVAAGVTPCTILPGGTMICCSDQSACCGTDCCDREDEFCCEEECCPNDATCCPNGCSDLMTDPTNCGECGRECPDPLECRSGECIGET
jgi:hypothetical protein